MTTLTTLLNKMSPAALRASKATTLLLTLPLLLAACQGGGGGAPQFPPAMVDIVPVKSDTWHLSYTTSGSVEANNKVDMNVETPGTITQLNFKEGEPVRRGQVLVRLRGDKFAAQMGEAAAQVQSAKQDVSVQEAEANRQRAIVESAKSRLNLARAELQRYDKLFRDQFISSLELEQKRTAYETANAEYQAAQKELDTLSARRSAATAGVSRAQSTYRLNQALANESVIRAPFSGMIGQKYVALGDYVVPGEKVLTVVDDSALKVVFSLPERYLPYLKTGQTVQISFDGNFSAPEVIEAQVNFIDAVVNPENRTVTVKAIVQGNPSQLRHGQSVIAKLLMRNIPNALVVPEQAIVPQGEKTFVYVAKPMPRKSANQSPAAGPKDPAGGQVPPPPTHQAALTEVTIANRDTGRAQIASGLNPGDQIITTGLQKIFDGAPVIDAGLMSRQEPMQPAAQQGAKQ